MFMSLQLFRSTQSVQTVGHPVPLKRSPILCQLQCLYLCYSFIIKPRQYTYIKYSQYTYVYTEIIYVCRHDFRRVRRTETMYAELCNPNNNNTSRLLAVFSAVIHVHVCTYIRFMERVR